MQLPALSKATLERTLSGAFDTSPILQNFPIARWVAYKACNLPLKERYPSLIESLSRLGLFLSAVGLSVSLLNCTIIPTISCVGIMMIFRSTIVEFRKQVEMHRHIQRLETVNIRLEDQVLKLQNTLETAQVTTESIHALKQKELESLAACQEVQNKLEIVTYVLETKFSTIQQDLTSQVGCLTTQVNRLKEQA